MKLKEEEGSRICREVSIKAGADAKESACNAGDPGSIPEMGRIPWTEESGRLQPMESQRGGCDWSDWACSTHMPGTKLIEEGVDKNHGFSKCVEFVSFLFFIHLSFLLFFFDASICMCGGWMLWWGGSRVAARGHRRRGTWRNMKRLG